MWERLKHKVQGVVEVELSRITRAQIAAMSGPICSIGGVGGSSVSEPQTLELMVNGTLQKPENPTGGRIMVVNAKTFVYLYSKAPNVTLTSKTSFEFTKNGELCAIHLKDSKEERNRLAKAMRRYINGKAN